jgi:predicted transcriptional regulator
MECLSIGINKSEIAAELGTHSNALHNYMKELNINKHDLMQSVDGMQ